MSNILSKIAETPLDSSTRYVCIHYKCGSCGHVGKYRKRSIKDLFIIDLMKNREWKAYCSCNGGYNGDRVTWLVTKVLPSKCQKGKVWPDDYR